MSGAVEVQFGGAASERAVSAVVETGGRGFALHAGTFGRRTDSLRVPAFERPLKDGSTERRTRGANSASRASGGALGGSLVWDRDYLGASVDNFRNDYGIVFEDDITIEMRRDKFALAGGVRSSGAFITTLRGQAASTDHHHQEIEGGASVGTTSKRRGSDGRLEAVHQAFALGAGRLEGMVGAQFESSRFWALGEEAFAPSTRTRQSAVFLVERWTRGERCHLSAGLRSERMRVQSEGDADPAEVHFGPAQARRFSPGSAALGGVLNLGPQWQLSANWAATWPVPG